MKYFFFLVSFFILNSANAQNPSYGFIYDSIFPLTTNNYKKAKDLFLQIEEQYKVDPNETFLFVKKSLQNNDLPFFKSKIKNLIEDHGLRYSNQEYSLVFDYEFTTLLKENNIEAWMVKQSDSLFPIWVKNNPRAYEIQRKMHELLIIDQGLRSTRLPVSDSICDVWTIIEQQDYDNLFALLSTVDSSRVLPNNFDHGIGVYNLWKIVFLHNIKTTKIEDIWNLMQPYLEKTFLEGKISDDCFYMLDYHSSNQFGYQYFGYIKDVPIKTKDNLVEIRRKLGFL